MATVRYRGGNTEQKFVHLKANHVQKSLGEFLFLCWVSFRSPSTMMAGCPPQPRRTPPRRFPRALLAVKSDAPLRESPLQCPTSRRSVRRSVRSPEYMFLILDFTSFLWALASQHVVCEHFVIFLPIVCPVNCACSTSVPLSDWCP